MATPVAAKAATAAGPETAPKAATTAALATVDVSSWRAWGASGGLLSQLPARFINLDRSKDRLRYMQREVVPRLPRLQRQAAVDARALDPARDGRVSLRTRQLIAHGVRFSHKDIDSAGEVACALSHIQAWREMLAAAGDRDGLFLIMEDNPIVDDEVLRVVQGVMTSPDVRALERKPATVWNLAPNTTLPGASHAVPGYSTWMELTGFFGTKAYIANRAALRVLIDNALPLDAQVDGYMSQLAAMGMLTVLQNTRLRPRHAAWLQSTIGHSATIGMDEQQACGGLTYTWRANQEAPLRPGARGGGDSGGGWDTGVSILLTLIVVAMLVLAFMLGRLMAQGSSNSTPVRFMMIPPSSPSSSSAKP